MGNVRLGLSLKLIVCLVGSMIVIFSLLGYQSIRIHKRNLEEMTNLMAERISNTIKDSTRYSMLQNHRDEVYHIITTIGSKPGIKKIRIFNKEGKISFSTDASEVNTFVDKKAEACYACHSQEHPLDHLDRPDRVRTYMGADHERILGLINPIENAPACSNSGCHAHTPDKQMLGVLDVTLSLAGVDQTIAQGERSMIMTFIVAILVISAIFATLIWIMIYRPVKQLIRGTKQVAAGNLDSTIEVSSQDEIGELASSFNHMTRELKVANEELTDWAKTMEKRVDEKTLELKRANDQMIQVERMASIGKLAAIVAHEINNPLAGILTYAKLLLKKMGAISTPDAEVMKQDLQMIAGESARCGEIVKSLLQFARQTVPNLQPHDVNEIIRQSMRLVQHKMHLMNLETKIELEEKLPFVVCDEQQIKQALVALLINACEAMHPEEGLLEVGSRNCPERQSVRIIIKDNGIGMDEETQKHIFEPFFTTKESIKGMGLGLAVVFGIIGRHSGTIVVESAPGRGAKFVIELPVKPEMKSS